MIGKVVSYSSEPRIVADSPAIFFRDDDFAICSFSIVY
jgi:hypothetical protein